MSPSPAELLRHIIDELEYLLARARDLNREEFVADETLKRAFVRSIEIVGEAAKKLPDEFRRAHPDIPWREMAGMRDRLIHGYFGVDYDIVWDVAVNEAPRLRRSIQRILREEL